MKHFFRNIQSLKMLRVECKKTELMMNRSDDKSSKKSSSFAQDNVLPTIPIWPTITMQLGFLAIGKMIHVRSTHIYPILF